MATVSNYQTQAKGLNIGYETPGDVDFDAMLLALPEDYKRHWLQAYWDYLYLHCTYVREAGLKLGVSREQLAVHDASKTEFVEFPFYARQFFGDRGDPVGWSHAWLHHQNHNPHHWEYWIMRSGHERDSSGADEATNALPMPDQYLREMVADWCGASKAFTDDWDIEEWYVGRRGHMILHPQTRAEVEKLVKSIRYGRRLG